MTSLLTQITALVSGAFQARGFASDLGIVTLSERPDLGQFQCSGALRGAKQAGMAPRALAEAVAEELRLNVTVFKEVTVEGPGFINLVLTDEFLAEQTNEFAQRGDLIPRSAFPKRVVVDFGGPNVAKPLHVGHLRSSIIGDSIRRLLLALGHEVYGDIHLGDWGTPMGILIAQIESEQPDLPYFDESFEGDYPVESPVSMDDLARLYPLGSNRVQNEPEFKSAALKATAQLQAGRKGFKALWEHFVRVTDVGLERDFKALGVHFDWWYGESHYDHRIAPLVERLRSTGTAIESEGALIVPLEPVNGQEIPPLILLKSDGAFLYSTTDMATIDERVSVDKLNELIYVVDQRQHLHFVQVFAAARKAGILPEDVTATHAGFGTMNGTDGKPFKTRSGGVMKLKDLIAMVTEKALERMDEAGISKDYPEEERAEIAKAVGIAALKFGDLINNRVSNYIFDLDRFVSFDGKTGPYLVYTAVRIRSIMRRLELSELPRHIPTPTDIERPLHLMLSRLPEAIAGMERELAPHILCEYTFNLAQEFNRFYQNTSIIHEADIEKRDGWIALSLFTLRQLEFTLGILGISVPERM
jgi:arginyl-tRNA synthetase